MNHIMKTLFWTKLIARFRLPHVRDCGRFTVNILFCWYFIKIIFEIS